MALNPNSVGKAIADYWVSNAPAPGVAVTTAELETLWQGVIGLLYADIKATMNVLPASISGLPLTVPTAIPVATTGSATAQTGATTSPEEVIGTGSVL